MDSTSHTSPAIYNVTAVWSSGFQQRTGVRTSVTCGEHVAATTYDLEDHPRTDLDMWIGSPPMKISHEIMAIWKGKACKSMVILRDFR